MTELKKKITINREHLNPSSSQKRNGSVKNRKLPGFIKPSELKINLINLLKQKREEKQTNTINHFAAVASVPTHFSNNGNVGPRPRATKNKQPFNRQKYTDIF